MARLTGHFRHAGDRYYPTRDNPYNNKVEKRAAHDARTYTKVNTVRSHHKGGVNADPSGAPQASYRPEL